MKINSAHGTSFCRMHGRSRIVLLAAALLIGGGASNAYALGGYTVWSWGTTSDSKGVDIGPTSDRTCFISGVAGNINDGVQAGTQTAVGLGCGTYASTSDATITISNGHWQLLAHGGACGQDGNGPHWDGNPVLAEATCFLSPPVIPNGSMWVTGDNPVRIADQFAANGKVRQCFLTGVEGMGGEWNNENNYARVRRIPKADQAHPTTGWYIEANMPFTGEGGGDSKSRVFANCVDFPPKTALYYNTTSLSSVTQTVTLPSGTGIRACAIWDQGGVQCKRLERRRGDQLPKEGGWGLDTDGVGRQKG